MADGAVPKIVDQGFGQFVPQNAHNGAIAINTVIDLFMGSPPPSPHCRSTVQFTWRVPLACWAVAPFHTSLLLVGVEGNTAPAPAATAT